MSKYLFLTKGKVDINTKKFNWLKEKQNKNRWNYLLLLQMVKNDEKA